MSGTVNIARDIWQDTAFKAQPFTEREAFVWLVMEASYKAREKRVGNVCVNLSRGQLASSIRFMAEAWDWQKSTVDRFLKRLQKRDMIGTDSGTGLTVITICKYDEYQSKPSEVGTAKDKQRDSSGTAAGRQRDKPNKGLITDERRMKEDIGASIAPENSKQSVSEILEGVASTTATESFIAYRRRKKGGALTTTAAKRLASSLEEIMRRRPIGCLDDWASDALGMAEERGWQSVQADWYLNAKGKNDGTGNNGNASAGQPRRAGDGGATVDAFREIAARYGSGPQ